MLHCKGKMAKLRAQLAFKKNRLQRMKKRLDGLGCAPNGTSMSSPPSPLWRTAFFFFPLFRASPGCSAQLSSEEAFGGGWSSPLFIVVFTALSPFLPSSLLSSLPLPPSSANCQCQQHLYFYRFRSRPSSLARAFFFLLFLFFLSCICLTTSLSSISSSPSSLSFLVLNPSLVSLIHPTTFTPQQRE